MDIPRYIGRLIYRYKHTYIDINIHIYIHADIHTYRHRYTYRQIHIQIHTYITCIDTYIPICVIYIRQHELIVYKYFMKQINICDNHGKHCLKPN